MPPGIYCPSKEKIPQETTMTTIPGWERTAGRFNKFTDTLMDIIVLASSSSARLEAQTAAAEHLADISQDVPHATNMLCQALSAAVERRDNDTRLRVNDAFTIAYHWHHHGKDPSDHETLQPVR